VMKNSKSSLRFPRWPRHDEGVCDFFTGLPNCLSTEEIALGRLSMRIGATGAYDRR
jgi:hypothetical protein